MDADAPLPALATAPIPRATYRLQFNAGFTLADATAAVPYLHALGVSHVYASPLLAARPGSTHGYDVIDPTRLNPEVGSDADFAALHDVLRGHGMGLVLDIVPNHMGVLEADNPWWLDVLENGPAAEHATYFDIEWQPPLRELHGKLLLPVLGRPYGDVLEAGELQPVFDAAAGRFELRWHGHRFPVDAADNAALLAAVPLPAAAGDAGRAAVDALRQGFARLPSRDDADATARARRRRDAAALKCELQRLHATEPWAPRWLDACAAALHGVPGDAASFDRIDALIQRQAWRPAFWRAAADEINYRRFFDVDGLAALRVEDPAVFDASHALVQRWLADGRVDGLRIDHPDGMADPAAYFRCLQQGRERALYVVVEKILGDDEAWPRGADAWPVHGDTGYRFANLAIGLFVDTRHAAAFDALTARFVGAPQDFDAELDAAKREIMATSLAADLRTLSQMAHALAQRGRMTRDLTRAGLEAAIVEFTAAFDVYRSYVSARGVPADSRARIEKAVAAARARCRPSLHPYLDFVRTLLLAPAEHDSLRFAQRLQQFTAPVMAKAMEDTVFYRWHRLVALNDVGGDPRRFGIDVDAFHAANADRLAQTPHTLLATSTHDSKRSEDVRTRLAVLSEMPQRWSDTALRWREQARTQWRIGGLDEGQWPTPADELLLFETLLGIWPVELADDPALHAVRDRVVAYMRKAVREAKHVSSWLDANDDYERALERAVELLLARLDPNPFLTDLRRFAAEVAPFGCVNSLALVVLKLTAPGVPDLYQGCEDWAFALVDPDNRRRVDFAALRDKLGVAQRLHSADAVHALRRMPLPRGLHKLFVAWRVLQWRREAEALFCDGDVVSLVAQGRGAPHVVAFARRHGDAASITIVPRLAWQLADGDVDRLLDGGCWADTTLALPAGLAATRWRDVIGARDADARDGLLPLAGLLRGLPVAVLRPA